MSLPRQSPKILEDITGATLEDVDETIRSLRILLEGDPQEQCETFAFLARALDEDRPTGFVDAKGWPEIE